MQQEEMYCLARKLLGLSAKDELRQQDMGGGVLHVYEPIRGGASMLISPDGTVLYADSSVPFDEHLEAFAKGVRTPLESFIEDKN